MLRLPPAKLQPWRRVRREPVTSNRIFEVARVELQDAAGRPRGDGFTLRGNDWCNVVAITPEDQVVLVWQYRFGSDALSLEIPGGVVDPGESPEQAARRELREETGYEAEGLHLLLEIDPNPAIQENRCFTFVAQNVRPDGTFPALPGRGQDLKRAFPASSGRGQDLERTFSAPRGHGEHEEIETALAPGARIAELLDGGQITHSLARLALEVYWRTRGAGGIEQLAAELERLQRRKVLELARRLRPGVTLEDVANPHDFPELGDPDWQYEDGMLAGIQSVLAAIRAQRRQGE